MMCFSCRVTSDAKVVFLDVIPTPQDIISDFCYLVPKGGTFYTVSKALESGKPVINLYERMK